MYSVADEFETINSIFALNASIARFGDGEIRICLGGKTKAQDFDKHLCQRLIEILKVDELNFLIGVPRCLNRKDDYPAKDHWLKFVKNNKIFHLFSPTKKYYSSFVSRSESAPQIACYTYWSMVECVWLRRNIVLVEGERKQLSRAVARTGDMKRANSVKIVECPSRNAFEKYDEIFEEICNYPKDSLIVMSLGATATVLAYDLYKEGYQALDVGRMIIHHERILQSWKNGLV